MSPFAWRDQPLQTKPSRIYPPKLHNGLADPRNNMRKVCKTFLRNDYWCKGLGFSPTKSAAYKKYQELMARRRKDWNIFPEIAT